MFGIELSGRLLLIFDVIGKDTPANQYGIEPKINVILFLVLVLTGKSIQHELQIQRFVCRGLPQIDSDTEKTDCSKYQFIVEKRKQFKTCSQLMGSKKDFTIAIRKIDIF